MRAPGPGRVQIVGSNHIIQASLGLERRPVVGPHVRSPDGVAKLLVDGPAAGIRALLAVHSRNCTHGPQMPGPRLTCPQEWYHILC